MNSVISFILGAVAGFIANKVLEGIERFIKDTLENRRVRKEIKLMNEITEEKLNVISIVNGHPYYEKQNMNISVIDKKLYIGFPKELIDKLDEGKIHSFHDNCSFNGKNTFEDIVKETGIKNLTELIEKHRKIVAQQFINKENGCYFNGEKYGVYEINPFERTIDEKEEAKLEIVLYTTDYFTHKVFKSIYKEIKDTDPIGKTRIKDLKRYRAFTTSFGINGIVGVKSKEDNKSIILTKRSCNATDTNNMELCSVSVIEGLTKTDYDTYNKKVDLYQGFKRGLTEELGINENMYSDDNIKFYDLFLELNKYELGITCYVNLDDKYIFEKDIQHLYAKDNTLEVAEKFVSSLNKKSINKLIDNNEFNKQSLYTIKSILARI